MDLDLLGALKRNKISAARALLASGADPEESNDQSTDFPLKVAAERNILEMVPLLLEAGAELNRPGYNGITPLAAACLKGHLKIVKILAAAGADFQLGDDFGHSPLFWAVVGAHLALVEWLVEHGASFSELGLQNESPMYRSVSGLSKPDSPKILKYFLSQGADPNHCGPNGTSLLMAAALDGNLESVQTLLIAGADVCARTDAGEAILNLVCRSRLDRPEIMAALLDAGAELNVLDQWQCDVLRRAAEQGLPETIKLLIKAGLSPNQNAKNHPPVLILAIRAGHESVAQSLVAQGANPEPGLETTPLMEALARRQYTLSKMLIAAGADLQARDHQGTVLMYALGIIDGYLYERSRPPKISTPFIRWLLLQGVALDRYDYPSSPAQLAQKKGLKQIAVMLRKRENSQP